MIMIDKLINQAKAFIGKIKVPQVKIPAVPKIKMPNLKPLLNRVKPLLNKAKPALLKAIGLLKKALELAYRLVKGFVAWFGKAIKESIAQVWTLLGFFIAWLTLTGTAQQIVGTATIAATILWLITIPLREEKDE
jgi:hypothetical protein